MVGTRQAIYMTGVSREGATQTWVYVAAMVLLIQALPPAIYGYLAYRQFDFFRFTYYVPYEDCNPRDARRPGATSQIPDAWPCP